MKLAFRLILAIALVILMVGNFFTYLNSGIAATPTDFDGANNAIGSAFTSLHSAEDMGGNVTTLVAQLNIALALYQKAETENSTNPVQAAVDLSNATVFANNVKSESVLIGSSGNSARAILENRRIEVIIMIVVGAGLVYIFGGRIYRRVWLNIYKDFVVKPQNG